MFLAKLAVRTLVVDIHDPNGSVKATGQHITLREPMDLVLTTESMLQAVAAKDQQIEILTKMMARLMGAPSTVSLEDLEAEQQAATAPDHPMLGGSTARAPAGNETFYVEPGTPQLTAEQLKAAMGGQVPAGLPTDKSVNTGPSNNKRRRGRSRLSLEEMQAMRAAGRTVAQIAEAAGLRKNSVYSRFLNAPAPARTRPTPEEARQACKQVADLRAQGLSHAEIGAKLGITEKASQQRLYKHNQVK